MEILNNDVAGFACLKRYMKQQVDHGKLYMRTKIEGWAVCSKKRWAVCSKKGWGILNNNKILPGYIRVTTIPQTFHFRQSTFKSIKKHLAHTLILSFNRLFNLKLLDARGITCTNSSYFLTFEPTPQTFLFLSALVF